MKVTSFKDLSVWRIAMALIPGIYDIASKLPPDERYALADQLRRAAVSIPSNIAEGSKRSTRLDFRKFCKIAQGSAAEVETQLLIVKLLYSAIDVEHELQEIVRLQKMLTTLTQRLR